MKKVITTNCVRYNESYFPYRRQSVIDEHVKERFENQLEILVESLVKHMIRHCQEVHMKRCTMIR